MLSEIRERQILYDLAQVEWGGGWANGEMGVKRYKLAVMTYASPGGVVCGMETTVNNTVLHI